LFLLDHSVLMLKHKLESWNGTRYGEGEWKQFIGNLADSIGILYEYHYQVADHHRAPADSNMHCSPWFNDDDDVILVHSRYADGQVLSRMKEMPVGLYTALTQITYLSNFQRKY